MQNFSEPKLIDDCEIPNVVKFNNNYNFALPIKFPMIGAQVKIIAMLKYKRPIPQCKIKAVSSLVSPLKNSYVSAWKILLEDPLHKLTSP